MADRQEINRQRQAIIEELKELKQIRRGSVTEQYVEARRADGTTYRRGPYPIYTYKERGRTVSKRIKNPELLKLYRDQIDNGRAFHERMIELLRLGEALSDAAVDDATEKKGPRLPSKRARKSNT